MQQIAFFFRPMRFVTAALFVLMLASAFAQYQPASPPVADPKDGRFDEVHEDFSSPSLDKSHLLAVPALSTGVGDHGNYTTEIVRVQWRFGDPIDLYICKPKLVVKPGVVLYLYGHNTDSDRFSSERFQEGATKDGYAAVGFVSALTGARYHDRPMSQWFVSELPESLAASAHDVQMILNYLAIRGDFDMDRVGMLAQDSGASIAILAASADPRIKALDLVDPWGDWPDWLASSPVVPGDERARYVKDEFLNKLAGLEPMTLLPKITAKIRLQDAVFLPSTPEKAKEKIRKAAPPSATVVVYHTPEETKEVAQGNKVLEWLHQQLAPSHVQQASTSRRNADGTRQ